MYYAKFSPRGFSNEYELRAFTTRELRDRFVNSVPRTVYSEHYHAWVEFDNGSAWAVAISSAEVSRLTREDRMRGYDRAGNWVRGVFTADGACPLRLAEYFSTPVRALDDRGRVIPAAQEVAA